MKTIFNCVQLLLISLILCSTNVFGHERSVHRRITEAAADSANGPGSVYSDFLQCVSSEIIAADARSGLSDGSDFEDNFLGGDEGGMRSLNHFYDPLTGQGLSNIPLDDRIVVNGQVVPVGRDSFTWASTRDCPGVDIWLTGIGLNAGKYNIWSWQNARDKEWLGLTASSRSSRQAALLEMFRAVGQFVHLLEDASQPEHTRNEQHLSPGSPIEEYGEENVSGLNYQPGMLDWRAAGFTKMKDFWDRNSYTGDGAALDEDAGGGAKLGMAEFSNGNFLGARHQYPEYFSPGDVRHYPLPSRDNSTNYKQVKADPSIGLDTYTLKNGAERKGIYVRKNGDGISVNHLSRINYLGAKKFSGLSAKAFCTIDDPNVLYDYHDKLIPKASEYSAGILDYFFRGKLEVVSVVWDGSQYTITVRNQSGQELANGGKFFVLKDDSAGNRSFVTSQNGVALTQNVLDGNTWQFNFPGPEVTTSTKFIMVYQGSIGLNGGNANDPSDPVDANIAIAARNFTISPPPPPCVPISSFVWSPQGSDVGTTSFNYSAPTITFSVTGTDPLFGGGIGRTSTFESPGGCYLFFHYNLSGDSGTDPFAGIGFVIYLDDVPVMEIQIPGFGLWSDNDIAVTDWPLSPGGHTISVQAYTSEFLSIGGTLNFSTSP